MTTTTAIQREAVLISDRHEINVMGLPVWESLPAAGIPYEVSDPFILVHEGSFKMSQLANRDTRHPHRGFDNLWYVIKGSTSTGHTTGPGGAFERARLPEGSLLHVHTGRGVIHAEAIGADELQNGLQEAEFRGVLFWVNLARNAKGVEPTASVVQPDEMPVERQDDATVRTLVGDGSPAELGTPALILDVSLDAGGHVSHQVPPEFRGFAYVLEGRASFGANRGQAQAGQLVLMGLGGSFAIEDAEPGTRYLLMAGKPYGETPRFNGPFVD